MQKYIFILSLLFFSIVTSCSSDEDTINPIRIDKKGVEAVNLDKKEVELCVGENYRLVANITPKDATNKTLLWFSENEKIIKVESGNITALSLGETDVKVKSEDGGKESVCSVKVVLQNIVVREVNFAEKEIILNIGEQMKLGYSYKPCNAENNNFIWKTNAENVAAVDQAGNITAKSEGNCMITISTEDGKIFDECTVVVKKEEIFGTYTDERDGKEYKTVKIGNQIWLAENFAYLPEVSPENENGSESIAKYYVYGNFSSDVEKAKTSLNYDKYGVLYNHIAALECVPQGWHLPSDEEWMELEKFLGMSDEIVSAYGDREGDFGYMLKSTEGWNDDNCTNESGFGALPAGCYYYYYDFFEPSHECITLGKSTYFWTATCVEQNNEKYYYRTLFNDGLIKRRSSTGDQGYSIRLVKDKE